MGYRATKTALRKLLALARGQCGYFTAKQAATLGYNYTHLVYHVGAENFERVGHGVYRLPTMPLSEHDDLVRLAFWSRSRDDRPQAVVSHQTALAVHHLSDVLPAVIRLTVPMNFRKGAPSGTVLYRIALNAADVEVREGFLVTTPLRTILDVAADDTVSEEHLGQAVREALDRGLVRKSSLARIVGPTPTVNRLSRTLADAT